MKKIDLSRIGPDESIQTNSPLDKKEALVASFRTQKKWPLSDQNPLEDRPGLWDNFLSFFNLNRKKIKNAIPAEERQQLENQDKIELLHQVIKETKFINALHQRAKETGKNKENMIIAIKPNFMFMYNKNDQTTYVAPILIEELVNIIYNEGFRKIYVVEARSTYGVYYYNRDVRSVAEYIGLDLKSSKYTVVDLSEKENLIEPSPPFTEVLKGTKVPRLWAEADFRISFAKNKTHYYSYYTLCIKCLYGALPAENKFKEYHCTRGLYKSTLEYIKHYPAHFGFIDAYVSADGEFGVNADKTPNYTRTILGSENIVALSWIGASKMGLDPMVSQFMKRAVKLFGKPAITLTGYKPDKMYSPWENVSKLMSANLNGFVDKHYKYGNFFLSTFANLDLEVFPRKKEDFWVKLARLINKPIRDMLQLNDDAKEAKELYDESPLEAPKDQAFDDIIIDE